MWTVYFDDECRVCRSFAERMARRLGPHQARWIGRSDSACVPELIRQRTETELVAVSPTGQVHGGIDAVAELLAVSGFTPARLLRLPLIHPIARLTYRAFARSRTRLGSTCSACGPVTRPKWPAKPPPPRS